jgi:hypothetical protein
MPCADKCSCDRLAPYLGIGKEIGGLLHGLPMGAHGNVLSGILSLPQPLACALTRGNLDLDVLQLHRSSVHLVGESR